MATDTSEPAFPGRTGYPGLSLRDYFAGQASACLWRHHNFLVFAGNDNECADEITNVAVLSYRIADAMLKARAI